jgi:hypothetical protein
MTIDLVVRDEERAYALWAVEDSISELLATASNLHEALDSRVIEQVLPTGAERLRQIQREAGTLLEELLALKQDYVAHCARSA